MTARSIKSAERTLALFELFSVQERRLRVSEVARELGIPQPSASMLLRNLVGLGYLDYDRKARTFGPTVRVMLLGSWITQRFTETGGIVTRLSWLQGRTGGETVFVAVQNGPAIQYIAAFEADNPNRLRINTGSLRTLTFSAAGRALLSVMPDNVISGWVRRCNAEAKEDRLRAQETEFLAMMDRVRKLGYAETAGDSIQGIATLAVAVRSPLGDMAMAVGAGGPIERIHAKRSEILTALLELKTEFSIGDAGV